MIPYSDFSQTIAFTTSVVCGIIVMLALFTILYHFYSLFNMKPVMKTISTCAILLLGIFGVYLSIYSGKLILLMGILESTSYTTTIVCGTIMIIALLSVCFRLFSFLKKTPVGPIIALSPSAIISLGIFGTFLGIYLGLKNFDTSDINSSIPSLLEGLKTAFITSLFGMFFSLVLRYIYSLFDKASLKHASPEEDDPIRVLKEIVTEVSSLSMELKSINTTFLRCFQSDEDFSLVSQLERIRADMNGMEIEISGCLKEMMKTDRLPRNRAED